MLIFEIKYYYDQDDFYNLEEELCYYILKHNDFLIINILLNQDYGFILEERIFYDSI